MTNMPNKIIAWPDFPDGCVTGRWSANTYYSELAVEYRRTDAPPVTVGDLTEWVERLVQLVGYEAEDNQSIIHLEAEIRAAIAQMEKLK